MEFKCPKCGDNIDARQGNIQTDLIQCGNCSSIHRLSHLVNASEKEPTTSVYKSNFEHRSKLVRFDANLPQKPLGSKITIMTTYDSLEVIAPKKSFGGSDIFIILFATFWLSFVAVWTFLAAMGTVIMALFSIPFWIAGLSMWYGIIKKLTEKQIIEADSYSIRILKKNIITTTLEEIPLSEISNIHIKAVNTKNLFSGISNSMNTRTINHHRGSSQILAPTISAGVKDVVFFENALEAEQDWMMEILRIVARKPIKY